MWRGIIFLGSTDAFSQIIEVEGHLIDSMILTKILDVIMDLQGSFARAWGSGRRIKATPGSRS